MELSFIIVNYNVTDLLRNCLLSIEKFAEEIQYEIIVIDNQSPDQSWKDLKNEFTNVRFIENEMNEGFSKANNKAIKYAQGDYILLLNPDTELESNQTKEVLDFVKSKNNFGCLGVRMHDAQGRFLPESKRSIPNMLNSFKKLFFNSKDENTKSYYRNDIDEYGIAEVEVITGAFLLCERQKYLDIGGLDEDYFMYGEDIDLCYTFMLNSYQNYYYGAMSILHIKGESTTKDKVYLDRFYGAMDIFVKKYYQKTPIQLLFLKIGLKIKHRLELLKL